VFLKCGSNTVEVTPQGIKVNGLQVSIEATAKAEIKAAMLEMTGSGMAKLAGGIVKIN
jgi:hypothetical protein